MGAIHIHLHSNQTKTRDRKVNDDPISMSKSKVLEKCKSGEWEAMQDVVANRTLQFRKNGKTFFVRVTDN